jgi:Peptidase A4 family
MTKTLRRALPLLAVSATVAGALAASAVGAPAQTVNAQLQQSENWAGYVAKTGGQNFTSVSGSWTQPTVSPGSGDGYSAFWVGLGGSQQDSQALEQVGTAADVVNGQTQYYAWYELVPDPEIKLDLPINPGDHIAAKVTVNGTQVTVSLSDETTGKSATKTLEKSNPDTSSAEWIAEAPAASQGNGLQVLPLADFGKVSFASASATAGGHTGSISDSSWSAQPVELSSAGGSGAIRYPGGAITPDGASLGDSSSASSGGASPSNLSGDGSAFDVSYSSSSGEVSSQSSAGNPDTSGYGGSYPDTGGYGGSYPDSSGYGGSYPETGGYGGYSDGGGYPDAGGGYAYVLPGGYAIGL